MSASSKQIPNSDFGMEALEVLAPASFYPTCKRRVTKSNPAVSRPGTHLLTRAGGVTGAWPTLVSPSSHAGKAKVKMAPWREGRKKKLKLIILIAQTEGKEAKRVPADLPGGKELIL